MRRSVVNWRVLQSLPSEGIKVFASQLHTHLTGRRAYTKHYRNGVELPELNRDNHFSPHYQEIRKLPRQVHVLPVRCLRAASPTLPARLRGLDAGCSIAHVSVYSAWSDCLRSVLVD